VSRHLPSRPVRGLAVLAVALAALTACGGDDGGGDGGGEAAATTSAAPTTSAAAPSSAEESATESAAPTSAESAESQTVTATEGEMFIELSEDSFSAGSYTFEVLNSGSATHDFVVERNGDDVVGTDSIAPGNSSTVTVDLEPGEYVFYCSIGNHRAMGMEVTVTVT
jgi:plastocyanin